MLPQNISLYVCATYYIYPSISKGMVLLPLSAMMSNVVMYVFVYAET